MLCATAHLGRFPTNESLLEAIRSNIEKWPAQAWFHMVLRLVPYSHLQDMGHVQVFTMI
jgi:hypothetical protein